MKYIKEILLKLIIILLVFSFLNIINVNSTNYNIFIKIILKVGSNIMYVNDNKINLDTPPIIYQNRTYLPIRYIAEAFNANVDWYQSEKKVTIILKDINIELWINKNIAKVNNEFKYIDKNNLKVTPIIYNGRTMLPIRFIAENLDCIVDWNDLKKEVIIYREEKIKPKFFYKINLDLLNIQKPSEKVVIPNFTDENAIYFLKDDVKYEFYGKIDNKIFIIKKFLYQYEIDTGSYSNAYNNYLICYDENNLNVLWYYNLGFQKRISKIIKFSNYIYLTIGDYQTYEKYKWYFFISKLICLNINNGQKVWDYNFEKLQYISDPFIINDKIYVISLPYIYTFSINGELIKKIQLPNKENDYITYLQSTFLYNENLYLTYTCIKKNSVSEDPENNYDLLVSFNGNLNNFNWIKKSDFSEGYFILNIIDNKLILLKEIYYYLNIKDTNYLKTKYIYEIYDLNNKSIINSYELSIDKNKDYTYIGNSINYIFFSDYDFIYCIDCIRNNILFSIRIILDKFFYSFYSKIIENLLIIYEESNNRLKIYKIDVKINKIDSIFEIKLDDLIDFNNNIIFYINNRFYLIINSYLFSYNI